MNPNPELIAECRKYLEENLDRSYSQDSETINAIAAHFAAKIEEAKREGYNAALEENENNIFGPLQIMNHKKMATPHELQTLLHPRRHRQTRPHLLHRLPDGYCASL